MLSVIPFIFSCKLSFFYVHLKCGVILGKTVVTELQMARNGSWVYMIRNLALIPHVNLNGLINSQTTNLEEFCFSHKIITDNKQKRTMNRCSVCVVLIERSQQVLCVTLSLPLQQFLTLNVLKLFHTEIFSKNQRWARVWAFIG